MYANHVAKRPQPIIFDPTHQNYVPFISRQIPRTYPGALQTRLDHGKLSFEPLHEMVKSKNPSQLSEEKE